MNLSQRWVAALVSAGYEAVHWRTVGDRRASDAEIMAYARTEGYVVLTHDLDFGDLLAVIGGDGPSVVQIRSNDVKVENVFERVLEGLLTAADALAAGALVTIDMQRSRVRLLPLRPKT